MPLAAKNGLSRAEFIELVAQISTEHPDHSPGAIARELTRRGHRTHATTVGKVLKTLKSAAGPAAGPANGSDGDPLMLHIQALEAKVETLKQINQLLLRSM